MKCVVAARLEPGDVGENEAALKLASRLAGAHLRCSPPFTGRVNLFAESAGLAIAEADAIDRVNAVDEAITVATLPPLQRRRRRRHGCDGQNHSFCD